MLSVSAALFIASIWVLVWTDDHLGTCVESIFYESMRLAFKLMMSILVKFVPDSLMGVAGWFKGPHWKMEKADRACLRSERNG